MSDMIQDTDFIYWDNNNPPQLWAWSGEYGDEASEPLFRLPTEGLGDECRMLDAANYRLRAENQRLREALSSISKTAETLRQTAIDGQNELHGIRHAAPAKRTFREIEQTCEAIRDTAANLGGED